MIEIIHDLPDRVLGFRAKGQITADDYHLVLVPALEEKLKQIKRVRLLYVLGEGFDGYTGGAAWEDTKVGMRHLAAFDRIAVVTDVDWVRKVVKAFGFTIPGEVRVFGNGELDGARAWVSEPDKAGDLRFQLLEDEGVLVLEPKGELEAADFERLAAKVDPYIEKAGELRGLMIVTEHFPGWDDFAAMTSHLRFVREHHKKVRRIALVTEGRLLSMLPRVARLFIGAEARAFPMKQRDDALLWTGGND
jgi:hypothetical protein